MPDRPENVVNAEDVTPIERLVGEHWGAIFSPLTPAMRPGGGSLGVNLMRVPSGRSLCPFHYHQREDEAFYVLSGRGVLRYGDTITEIGPGDCISCPAGTGVAHQIANPNAEDLVYLAMGTHDPDEVCVYPDNGKVMVRGIGKLGRIAEAPYMDGEPDRPRIFEMIDEPE
jgi:uncharacterized cupin superfamily protein